MMFLLQPHEWVITILTISAFAAGIIGYLFSRRPKLPDGVHYEGYLDGCAVDVVYGRGVKVPDNALPEGIGPRSIAAHCATAVAATRLAVPREAREPFDRVCVHFVTNERFEAFPYANLVNAAAFLIETGGGKPIPMAVIRERHLEEVLKTGEPVIHEMLHMALGAYTEPDKDRDHSHILAWRANAGEESWQWDAQERFSRMTGRI